MSRLRILISDGTPSDEPHDLAVLTGNIASSPVKAVQAACDAFSGPVVFVAGPDEWIGGTYGRKLLMGRRFAAEEDDVYFLEEESIVFRGVRFIGSTAVSGVVRTVMLEPSFDGPTVAVSHFAPGDALGLYQPDVWIYGDGPNVDETIGSTRLLRQSGKVIEVGAG